MYIMLNPREVLVVLNNEYNLTHGQTTKLNINCITDVVQPSMHKLPYAKKFTQCITALTHTTTILDFQ